MIEQRTLKSDCFSVTERQSVGSNRFPPQFTPVNVNTRLLKLAWYILDSNIVSLQLQLSDGNTVSVGGYYGQNIELP